MSSRDLSISVEITVTLPSAHPAEAFAFHYVAVKSCGGGGTTDGDGDPYSMPSAFSASVDNTATTPRVPTDPSWLALPGNQYQLRLTPVTIAVVSGGLPPLPVIQPGTYRLCSLQVSTFEGTQYLTPGFGFDPGSFAEIQVPDLSSKDPRKVTVTAFSVQTALLDVP